MNSVKLAIGSKQIYTFCQFKQDQVYMVFGTHYCSSNFIDVSQDSSVNFQADTLSNIRGKINQMSNLAVNH